MNELDDSYIIKLKQAKVPDVQIAAKLGCTVIELNTRWNAILASAQSFEAMVENGYAELTKFYNNFALQYQLLGQTMAQIASVLQDPMTILQIADIIRDLPPEKAAEKLLKNAIVLKRFVAPDPSKLMVLASAQ